MTTMMMLIMMLMMMVIDSARQSHPSRVSIECHPHPTIIHHRIADLQAMCHHYHPLCDSYLFGSWHVVLQDYERSQGGWHENVLVVTEHDGDAGGDDAERCCLPHGSHHHPNADGTS